MNEELPGIEKLRAQRAAMIKSAFPQPKELDLSITKRRKTSAELANELLEALEYEAQQDDREA